MTSIRVALICALSAACGSSGRTDAGADADAALVPPRACRTGAPWSTARAAFDSSVTAAWGLGDARGTNLVVGDLDGDGFADLVMLDNATNVRTNLDAVPPVIHARVYLNRPRDPGPGRRFVDATRMSNLLATHDGVGYGRATSQVVFGDVDNDGDVDAATGVYVNTQPTAPRDPGDRAMILLNNGSGVFAVAPDSDITGPTFESPQSTGLAWLDYDRDGVLDVFDGFFYDPGARAEVGQQHLLFRGNGDGTFADVTVATGLILDTSMASFASAGQRRPLYGVTACDVNDDGRPDLLGMAYGRQWNFLYVNNGSGFTEQGRASSVAGDTNVDYHDDQSYLCWCQANPGACATGTPAPVYTCPLRGWTPGYNDQPWRLNGNTFSMVCGDVDNDGDLDVYSAEIHHPDVGGASDVSELLVNESSAGTVTFRRPGRATMGLTPPSGAAQDEGGLSAAMWDWDGDGRLDIYLGASDYPGQFAWMFHQNADGSFTEVGMSAGMHHACPHGLALADFDHDGDVDAIVGSSTARNCATIWPNGYEIRMYENVAGEANWTTLSLVGRGAGGANRSAIGARVRVRAGGVTQTREVTGVWGHYAGLGAELPVHFGLGSECAIEWVEVRWPDATGTVERFAGVLANYRVEIRQGSGLRYLD